MVDAAGCCSVFVCSAPTQTLKLRAAAPPPHSTLTTRRHPRQGVGQAADDSLRVQPPLRRIGRPPRPSPHSKALSLISTTAPVLICYCFPCLCFSQSPLFSLQPPGKNRTDAESALMRPNPHSWGERGFTLSVSFLVNVNCLSTYKAQDPRQGDMISHKHTSRVTRCNIALTPFTGQHPPHLHQ